MLIEYEPWLRDVVAWTMHGAVVVLCMMVWALIVWLAWSCAKKLINK